MLRELKIENIAVIERADIRFDEGFNVMTGETGAGKSIVIDSIAALTGARVSRDLIRSGCRILFINMDTDIPITLAREFPEVTFCQASMPNISIEGAPDNYHTFNGEIYQARYVSGVVAGMKLRQLLDSGAVLAKDAYVGYVAANSTAEVISGYTAFILGVRSVAPEAVMRVRYTGSWSNYNEEKKQARELIDEGCVIIAQHVNTMAPAVACEEAAAAGRRVTRACWTWRPRAR